MGTNRVLALVAVLMAAALILGAPGRTRKEVGGWMVAFGLLLFVSGQISKLTEGMDKDHSKDNDDDAGKQSVAPHDGDVDLAKTAQLANSPGIPGSQIPHGDEDLYILKSQVVPPVCPACPTVQIDGGSMRDCPPCPPCARCPEQPFECKKVPNYAAAAPGFLPSMFPPGGGTVGGPAPLARLNSFASFSDA